MWRSVTISREVFIPHSNIFLLWCLLECRVCILIDQVRLCVWEFSQSIQLQKWESFGDFQFLLKDTNPTRIHFISPLPPYLIPPFSPLIPFITWNDHWSSVVRYQPNLYTGLKSGRKKCVLLYIDPRFGQSSKETNRNRSARLAQIDVSNIYNICLN